MAEAYRYPLTRICIRSGSLTLPMSLLGVFPEHGEVVGYDTGRDEEFLLQVEGRRVAGLGPFFIAHELDVNDELHIRPLEDGRYAFVPFVKPKRPDFSRPEVIGKVLDGVLEQGVPMSEAEIRGLYPDIPSGFPLRQALEQDLRMVMHDGRWQARDVLERAVAEEQRRVGKREERRRAKAAAEAAAAAAAKAGAQTGAEPKAGPADGEGARTSGTPADGSGAVGRQPFGREARQQDLEADRRRRAREAAERERTDREAAMSARAEVEAALEAQAAKEAQIMALVEQDELERTISQAGSQPDATEQAAADDDLRRHSRERLAAHAEADALDQARRQRDARADRQRAETDSGEHETFGWDQPPPRRLRFPWSRRREEPKAAAAPTPNAAADDRRAAAGPNNDPLKLDRLGQARPVDRSAATPKVTPAPRPGLFTTDAALNSASLPPGDPAKTKRAREAFATLGYRVEGLAHGQLMLHTELGRRSERSLVHVLSEGQRLDWGALLHRRREASATYLAVVGDHRDLHRLVAPADLAKATLWSWAGLDRVLELANALPLGPFDLEPHFERDGLFEYGLERFERTVGKRLQERGAFSAVLERLGGFKAPSVFLLEDVASDAELPRDQALRTLERLSEAPWHLVSRVDSGEFCLRYRVHEALENMSLYATSLRDRLPDRQREKVRGLPDGVDPIGGDDVISLQADGAAPQAEATPPGDTELQAAGVSQQRLPFAGPGIAEDRVDDDVTLLTGEVQRRG